MDSKFRDLAFKEDYSSEEDFVDNDTKFLREIDDNVKETQMFLQALQNGDIFEEGVKGFTKIQKKADRRRSKSRQRKNSRSKKRSRKGRDNNEGNETSQVLKRVDNLSSEIKDLLNKYSPQALNSDKNGSKANENTKSRIQEIKQTSNEDLRFQDINQRQNQQIDSPSNESHYHEQYFGRPMELNPFTNDSINKIVSSSSSELEGKNLGIEKYDKSPNERNSIQEFAQRQFSLENQPEMRELDFTKDMNSLLKEQHQKPKLSNSGQYNSPELGFDDSLDEQELQKIYGISSNIERATIQEEDEDDEESDISLFNMVQQKINQSKNLGGLQLPMIIPDSVQDTNKGYAGQDMESGDEEPEPRSIQFNQLTLDNHKREESEMNDQMEPHFLNSYTKKITNEESGFTDSYKGGEEESPFNEMNQNSEENSELDLDDEDYFEKVRKILSKTREDLTQKNGVNSSTKSSFPKKSSQKKVIDFSDNKNRQQIQRHKTKPKKRTNKSLQIPLPKKMSLGISPTPHNYQAPKMMENEEQARALPKFLRKGYSNDQNSDSEDNEDDGFCLTKNLKFFN